MGKKRAQGQHEGVDGHQNSPVSGIFNRRRLSPTQRRLARYIIDNPRDAPFLSSVELARRVGVSQPSVTRLAVALGYDKYGDMQENLRRLVLSAAEDYVDEGGNKFQNAVAVEISNLRALRDYLADPSTVLSVGQYLAKSDPLCVLGLRVASPLAVYFGYAAKKIHSDVRILTHGSSTDLDQLARARHAGGEWMLCILMPRYPQEAFEALSYAKEIGYRVATITDRSTEPIEKMSDVVLTTGVGPQLVFDSQAAAMVLAGALLEAVADAVPVWTQERLEDFEQRAARLDLFAGE